MSATRRIPAAEDDSPYPPRSPQRVLDDAAMDAARSAALRDPAWQQPATVPENITFAEFRGILDETLSMSFPRSRSLTPASWWLYVKQLADREFNKAYDVEYPKNRAPQNGSDTSYEERLRKSGHLA